MQRQITQAELQACLDEETSVSRKMMLIRERIRRGASVEPGELGAFAENSDDFSPECSSYHNIGLDIDDAESIEKRLRWRADAEAERMRSKIVVIRGGSLEVVNA